MKMVTRLFGVLVLIALSPLVRAGLYDPSKPTLELAPNGAVQSLPHEVFRERLSDVIAIGIPMPESRYRKDAIRARDNLLHQPVHSPTERVKLGILRLRLREYDAALADLQQAYAANPRDFWTLAALGTAYQQIGQSAEAARFLEAARDMQPAELSAAAKSIEALQLKLARLRLREQANRVGPRLGPPDDVDNLFGVRFIGASGEYEAGTIDGNEKAKLPAEAIGQVQQLILWLPDDARLYWLLGELYAANGDIDAAFAVFDDCLNARRLDAQRLKDHRQAMMTAISSRPAPEAPPSFWPNAYQWFFVAAALGPVMALLLYFQIRELGRRLKRRGAP